MPDRRFFTPQGPFSLAHIAHVSGASLHDVAKGDIMLADVGPLDTAGPQNITFLSNRKYINALAATKAAACLVMPDIAACVPKNTVALVTGDPYLAYARIAALFYPFTQDEPGISPDAHIDPTAVIGEGCRIEAGVVIGAKAVIGAGSSIGAGTVIGRSVAIGEGAVISPNVTVAYSVIGKHAIIHSGARIGQDGFGFAPNAKGHVKIPQLGRVVIGDYVEIGANTTVDRGAGPDTVIGDHTKIDNLVQVAHNVEIGKGCFIAAMVGISGSTKIGNFVMLGGQAGIAGHITVGDGAQVAGGSGVMKDIPAKEVHGGYPATPIKEWHRKTVALKKLVKG